MQFMKFGFCATCALVCGLTSSCGGSSTPPPNTPDSVDQAAMAESRETASPTNPGHGVEVGMEFEDKGDDAAERRDRTPPPTQTYKPSNKSKQASAQ